MIRRLVSLLVVVLGVPVSAPAGLRNVVLMIGDDHGRQVCCYGDPVVKTPGLDRLATQGTRFTNGFAAVSSCSPSRSVILTGWFNHANGQYGLAHAVHNFHSLARVQSLPALLKAAGYRTAIVGKYHVEPPEVYPFDEQLPCLGGPRQVAAMADSARAFMARGSNQPFFLLVGFADPHRANKGFDNQTKHRGVQPVKYRPEDIRVPAWLPDNADSRSELAEYYESVSRMDRGVGMILDAVETTGHRQDTLVIYISDNGPPFPGAKTTLYDPGIHLPLIISSPDQEGQAVSNHAMVSWVDIAPTILDWGKAKVPKEISGRSLLPILGQSDPAGWDVVYGSHTFHEVTMYYPMRMIRTRQYKYILNLAHELEYPFASDLWGSVTWQGVLSRADKQYGQRSVQALIHRPQEELYDLAKDPDEIHNLAADPVHADALKELRARLRAWQEETKDPWIIKYRHE
ncbi:MAG: sulfatase [Phycisphaerae bacterium]|nr:sulfatase [Phycisphaerae bacterium]